MANSCNKDVGLTGGGSTSDHDWVLGFSNFREAWSLTPPTHSHGGQSYTGKQKGEGIFVAHPDTGYTLHPQLPTNNNDRYDILTSQKFAALLKKKFGKQKEPPKELFNAHDPLEETFEGHGTATASTLISQAGGVFGVAPMASMIPFRVTNTVILYDKYMKALVKAIHYCIGLQNKSSNTRKDIGVMSISLGRPNWGGLRRWSFMKALESARKAGIIIIAAAGQTSWFTPSKYATVARPAGDPNAIGIASCGDTGQRDPAGHFPYKEHPLTWDQIDLSAPGLEIWRALSELSFWSKEPTYSIGQSEGSSYATAITAGACALWQAYHNRDYLIARYGRENLFYVFIHCLNQSVDTQLPDWVDDDEYKGRRGEGILDACRLLTCELPSTTEIKAIKDDRYG